MSTNKTGASAYSRRSCGSARAGNTNDWSSPHLNTHQVPHSIKSDVMDLLRTRLSPDQLLIKYNKLQLLKKSSFYIMMTWQDILQTNNEHNISKSALAIDASVFQRLKKDAKCQVKIQLALLDMLLTELTSGREELEDILAQKSGACLKFGETVIQKKILRLQKATEDFDEAVIPGKIHLKPGLIPELENKKFQLVLEAEKPVMFNKEQSQAFCNSVVLHWYIAEQGQHKPNDEFEVHYKLINPTNEIEMREFGSLFCSSYVIKITNLRPGCSFKFSVKRRDNTGQVYNTWTDSIVLTTSSL